MLVDGGTVAWVGSDEAAAAHATGAEQVVELDGALVTPAFVDAHVHVTETGLLLAGLDLSGTRSLAEALDAVAAAARDADGVPVLGHGWDERLWPDQRPPTRQELDRAAGGAQVYLSRVDVHSAVVSTALAERAGLAGRAGWDGSGRVERDAHHAARDATRDLPRERRRTVQERALRAAAAAGIGSVHECSAPHVGSAEDLSCLLGLAGHGLPSVLAYWGQLASSAEEARGIVAALGVDVLGLAGDLCVDGSVGSRTSAFRQPYADAADAGLPADHCGHLFLDAGQVRDHVAACTEAGLQAGFHVIGDAAVDAVVAGLRAAADALGADRVRAARHRLEHVELVDDAAVRVLAELGVTASVQPGFDALWGGRDGMYAERLGPDRGARLNPFGALAAAGVPLALGSDTPVTPFDPWSAVRACAFHSDPGQRISARAAFLAHTRGGWRAARRDGEGALVPGAAATFAVWEASELVVQAPDDRIQAWSTDPRSGTPGLPDLTPGRPLPRCLRTVVAGAVAHDALT
jgi:predicted amidohydrolase YtcJ